MPYLITFKPSYQWQFIDLPKNLQRRITQAQAELEDDPMTPRGDTVKKLTGWQDLYRYRMDDYRLVYSVHPKQKQVTFIAVGPRKDIYKQLKYDPEAHTGEELVWQAEPAAEAAPEWQSHPEWFQPRQEPAGEPLPRRLSPSMLAQWLIPDEYHLALLRCRTVDELFSGGLPQHIVERVLDILIPPETPRLKEQPDLVLFNPEDLQRYAEGDLLGFLLNLDEQQKKYTDWALTGPTLLKGGPGSGKSTVALYRVRALVEKAVAERKPLPYILFTTYTNALVTYSESLLVQLLKDVIPLPDGKLPKEICVRTVDLVAIQVANRGESGFFDLPEQKQLLDLVRAARARLHPKGFGDADLLRVSNAIRDLRDEYLLAEITWVIEGQGCDSEDAYQRANRGGRLVPLEKEKRRAVWRLYTEFCAELERKSLVTWGYVRKLALKKAREGNFPGRWDYVIVDEAQDLTPVALALCVEVCKSPQGVFLTADANQSIYSRAFRWQQAHEQLKVAGRTRLLKRNYRSTLEVALAARDLLDKNDGADPEALDQEFVHRGRPPVVHGADGAVGQARWLAESIYRATRDLRLPVSAAAVLVPTNKLGENLAEMLSRFGMPAQYMASKAVKPDESCVKVMTLHAAKGLEFPIVAVAHVEVDRLPRQPETEDANEIVESLNEQRRLFFVGCTRAMRYLFVTYDRPIPSQFIDLLSDKHWIIEY